MEQKTCPKCEGREPKFFDGWCEAHNVCVTCGVKRSELTATPWGDSRGAFQCQDCNAQETQDRIAQRKADGFDHDGTDEIVCPHCGYEHSDSWEIGSGEHDCGECGEPFIVDQEIEVTYSTRVKK